MSCRFWMANWCILKLSDFHDWKYSCYFTALLLSSAWLSDVFWNCTWPSVRHVWNFSCDCTTLLLSYADVWKHQYVQSGVNYILLLFFLSILDSSSYQTMRCWRFCQRPKTHCVYNRTWRSVLKALPGWSLTPNLTFTPCSAVKARRWVGDNYYCNWTSREAVVQSFWIILPHLIPDFVPSDCCGICSL